jgi:hypothetical protein
MNLRDLTRRDFLSLSAKTAAGVLLASCTPSAPVARPRPRAGIRPEDLDTQWPIKRVVYLMLENRSFDNLFGRFPGANGTTVGVSYGRELDMARCPDWLPGDLPHDLKLAIQQALIAYSESEEGSEVLQEVYNITRLTEPNLEALQIVRDAFDQLDLD